MWPLLVGTGDGFDLKLCIFTAWSGIRGIVGLVLALLVLTDTTIGTSFGQQCFFLLSTTLVLKGGTYSLLAKVTPIRTPCLNKELVKNIEYWGLSVKARCLHLQSLACQHLAHGRQCSLKMSKAWDKCLEVFAIKALLSGVGCGEGAQHPTE